MLARPSTAILVLAVASLAGCAGGAAATMPAAEARPAAPRDPAAEAFAARNAKDFARAEAIASAEIDAGRGGARLYFERGVARMELGKREEALADLKRVNEIQEDPHALLLAGAVQTQLGRFADAEKDLSRAVALGPKNGRAWASLAQARIGLRDLTGAESAIAQAKALAPNDAFVRDVGDRLARAEKSPSAAAAPPAAQPAAAQPPAKP